MGPSFGPHGIHDIYVCSTLYGVGVEYVLNFIIHREYSRS